MKIFCLADSQELEIGFKLAGCEAATLEDNKEIEEKIDEIIKNENIGIFVISKNVYNKSKEKIDNIRLNKKLPLITII